MKNLKRRVIGVTGENVSRDRRKLTRNCKKGHENNVREPKSKVFYKCDFEGCGREFADKCNRTKHINSVHLNIRNFHCEYCGNSFKRSNTLKAHIDALHTKDVDKKQYKCDVCSKVFFRKIGLRLHQSLHTSIKPFVCSFEGCGKTYRLQTSLAKHEKRHLNFGEKPFHCHLCKERFSRKTYLDTHMYKHTGMKNYMCDICQKTFSQKGNMVTHKLLHSQDRPVFKCLQCFKAFNFKSNLKKHLEKHAINGKCRGRRDCDKSDKNGMDEISNSQDEVIS